MTTVRWSIRSSVLGGQVVAEIRNWGYGWSWSRGYVYWPGGELLAIQAGGVKWVHRDPVVKSQRLTDEAGNVTAVIELDPWGGETDRSVNQRPQPYRYTSYERDGDGVDQALMRSYHGWWTRFNEPDPWEGSYDLTDPQSFNRYTYVQNDPVNYVDPTGLMVAGPNTVYGVAYNPLGFWSPGLHGGFTYNAEGATGFQGYALPHTWFINWGEPEQLQNPVDISKIGEPPNPNCLKNAIVDRYGRPSSPGIGRPFAVSPRDPNLVSHHGTHALSPLEGGRVQTLAPLAGKVLHVGSQGGGLFVVDVDIGNGLVVSYFDLSSVSATAKRSLRTGRPLQAGDMIGTVRPAGNPRNYVGVHITLTYKQYYDEFKKMRQAGAIGFPRRFFVDPLGPNSPINCPGVPVQ